jgi:bacteriocin biosynthesis cyclodehydratase domain-containing protein
VPLLYVGMDGVDLRLGPYVVPGRTPCMWEVERQWLRASADSIQYESLMRVDRGRTAPTEIAVQSLNAALAPLLLELALRGTSSAVGSVRHVKVTTGTNSFHSVMRLPRCPVCLPMQPLTRNPLY